MFVAFEGVVVDADTDADLHGMYGNYEALACET